MTAPNVVPDLHPQPFSQLCQRALEEPGRQGTLFDLPLKSFYARNPAFDLSVRPFGLPAGTPVGPAAGPQTQLIPNLVLSWLGGARAMELKTVQILDDLVIPRPCIEVDEHGFNVEWSQELRIPQSVREYVGAYLLIQMLRRSGILPGEPETWNQPFVFDLSVGYDLEGIRSDKMARFFEAILDTRKTVEALRREIPPEYRHLADVEVPERLCHSVTLSTFHGCPPDEIERICEFLITGLGFNTIVKMNPTMPGPEELDHLLHDRLGYTDIRVNPKAFEHFVRMDEGAALVARLDDLARRHGLVAGAKFTNTLEIVNTISHLPGEVVYLSGKALHPLSLYTALRFREAIGREVPLSFSAGIDRTNFAETVACGFLPVTVCTDLLRPGGYGRFAWYLQALEKRMEKAGASTMKEYIGKTADEQRTPETADTEPSLLNHRLYVEKVLQDPRYGPARKKTARKKQKEPLVWFDCVSCGLCVQVCPNDANFMYPSAPGERDRFTLVSAGGGWDLRRSGVVSIGQEEQYATFNDYCNECGNCETFCPHPGAPYVDKPVVFGSRNSFEVESRRDGLLVEREGEVIVLTVREKGAMRSLRSAERDQYREGGWIVLLDPKGTHPPEVEAHPAGATELDLARYTEMRIILESLVGTDRVLPVK